jgi:uncharacterized protein YxjI
MAIGNKYSVSVNGTERFFAKSKVLRFLYEATLQDDQDSTVVTIKKRFSFLRALYDLRLQNGRTFRFRQESLIKPVYTCANGAERYEIFGHLGRKYSIFRRGRQVAALEKNKIVILEGDEFSLEADDGLPPELLCGMVLIIDNIHHAHTNNNTVSIDFGNLFQARACNESWKPPLNS